MSLGRGPIEAVLFDMGGVLLDFGGSRGLPQGRADWRGREALLDFVNDRRAKGKPALGEEDLERLLFGPWRQSYERRAEQGREADWGPHLTRLRRAAGGIRTPAASLLGRWFRPFGESVPRIPGARQTVSAAVALGCKLGLVSNVPLPGALYREVLARHELLDSFGATRFSYDSGSRKPSPAMVRSVLAALEVEAARAVFVGDRRATDVVAGRAAAVRTVWLRSADGGGPAPDGVIGSLSELSELLRASRSG